MKRRNFLRNAVTTAAGAIAIPIIITSPVFGNNVPDNSTGIGQIQDKVDWESFLKRHDLIWERTPDDYFNAPFAGNGLLGAMIYRPGGEPLRLDIGRMDVVEHRDTEATSIVDNGRLPVGYFSFETNASFINATGRLNLFNAEITLKTNYQINRTTDDKVDFRILVFHEVDAIMVEYEKTDKLQSDWMFHPAASVIPRTPREGSRYLNPLAEISIADGINICVQKRDSGGCYVTAWKSVDAPNDASRLLITIQDSYPGNEAVDSAIEVIERLSKKGEAEKQHDLHCKWWNNFYKASFISIPDAKMESTYWIQQYKFASMMRKNGTLCDLMGPWYKQTGWPGIWWNLNTQMLFSSLHISNQIELASTLPDFIIKRNDELINNVPEQWQHNSAGLPRCSGPKLQESILTWPHPDYPERSNLIYLCYYLWEYCRITMDQEYLRIHLFPLLRRAVNLLLHEVTIDSDGIIHTPYGHSPESTHDYDTNYDLSSLKWGCQTLLRINDQLNLNDSLAEKWQNVSDNLLPFPEDENGYMCSANKTAPLMHRHWCHLFMIYPYYLVNWEQPENHDVILRSIKHWGSPEIPNTWTQAVISSMYSSIRDGENALKHMELALSSPNFFPNTFHAEGRNPCSETYGGLCRMLQDMLIQSWGDKIRIFPGVSSKWKDVIFHKLRAEGGFEISARRENGETSWIHIKSLAGEPCIIESGFTDNFKVKGGQAKQIKNGLYSINLSQGEEVLLYKSSSDNFIVEQVESDLSEYNFYGLRNK